MLNANHRTPSLLADYVAENMLTRLEFLTLKPKRIVDISGKTRRAEALLRKHYPEAEINIHTIENSLSFENQSVDFIFANLIFSFDNQWEKILADCKRVLKTDGVLLFSCLGLDTLPNFAEKSLLQPNLFDMHNIGDALIKNKFADPVLEVEHVTFQYREREKFFAELKLNKMVAHPESLETNLSAHYEIIYGHAFGPSITADFLADENGVVKIPLSHLKRD